jgi:UDP-N-acetylglucosamine 2-epimerase (non-hydrolysing)
VVGRMTMSSKPFKISFVFGTRPEAIKVAPVIHHLISRDEFDVVTVLTGQHREMLDQVVEVFNLPVDHDLNVMTPDQSLESLTAKLCNGVGRVLAEERPDCVIVQGDTTSCLGGALVGFYHRIPVAHLEAGLRTNDPSQPFPEEINRRLVSPLTTYHFAPTQTARENLLRENVPDHRIWVTGNSGIDALRIVSERPDLAPKGALADALAQCNGTLIAVTSHRRENLPFMNGIASAVYELVSADSNLHVIFPVHLSPKVRQAVMPILADAERCHLLEPLAYDQFVCLMKRADIILSDSGGIQEEAPYLHKPVLVMRRTTERPEGVAAGTLKLVGDDQSMVFDQTLSLLNDKQERARMSSAANPFGDGHTSERVADILAEQLAKIPGDVR